MSWARCARCGREFSCDTAFDKHQRASYGDDASPVICLDPASVGLTVSRRGRWSWPARPGNPKHRLSDTTPVR